MAAALTAAGVAALLAACDADKATSLLGSKGGSAAADGGASGGSVVLGGQQDGAAAPPGADNGAGTGDAVLAARVVDYGEALRTASLKLVGELPTGAQIKALASAVTLDAQKAYYEGQVDGMLADPRFSARMVQWWRDTMRTGNSGNPGQGQPDFDTAAVLAAEIVVQDRPFTELFTSPSGNCPTFQNGKFQPAECQNGAPQAGILGNPGIMAQFYANLAFRRVRFFQETFVCTKFPAEYTAKPTAMGSGLYTSPWPFDSISGGTGARIDFKDTTSVICANCHTTLNHLSPLFAHFDANGNYNASTIQVNAPVPAKDPAEMVARPSDWLPPGETTAWRNGQPVADLPSLGRAMAEDEGVHACAVARVWNFAFSRGDIVNDLATLPPEVIADLVKDFTANGFRMRRLLRSVFTSADFVRF